MCLTSIKTRFKTLTAKEDITVIVIRKVNKKSGIIRSPYFPKQKWKIGKTETIPENINLITTKITKWDDSFGSDGEIKETHIYGGAFHFYFSNNCFENLFPTHPLLAQNPYNNKNCWFIAIIPKGTKYWKGKHNQGAARALKLIKHI